jgi:hypothetical protein
MSDETTSGQEPYPELSATHHRRYGDARTQYLASCLSAVEEAQRELRRRLEMLGHAIYRTSGEDWVEQVGNEALLMHQLAAQGRLAAEHARAELGDPSPRSIRLRATRAEHWGQRLAATYRWLTGKEPGEDIVREAEDFLARGSFTQPDDACE